MEDDTTDVNPNFSDLLQEMSALRSQVAGLQNTIGQQTLPRSAAAGIGEEESRNCLDSLESEIKDIREQQQQISERQEHHTALLEQILEKLNRPDSVFRPRAKLRLPGDSSLASPNAKRRKLDE
jgi:hypothetical protein